MPRLHPAHGLSLWQLLVTIAVAAVVSAAALPSFRLTSLRARGTASVNLLLGSLHFARSAALLTASPTALCLTADHATCLADESIEARGWLVFHDIRRGTPVRRDAGDTLLRSTELPEGVFALGTRIAVSYWPVARAGTPVTFLLCHRGQPQHGRAVIVSQSGRVRTAGDGAWTSALRCPA
jgi:type IV fimbrial biogenesis protein FimT